MTTGLIIGVIAGLLFGWLIMYLIMPKLVLKESKSNKSFDQTVGLVEKKVTEKGWKIPAVHDLKATMKKFDKDVREVKVFEICHPDYSYEILKLSEERISSSMMPCRISVYEKEDGSIWISRMNSGIMAKPMGRIIRKSMTYAARDVEEIIAEVLA